MHISVINGNKRVILCKPALLRCGKTVAYLPPKKKSQIEFSLLKISLYANILGSPPVAIFNVLLFELKKMTMI